MKVPAKIVAIRQETPTIKSLKLDLDDYEFNFLPGQWIDCYVNTDGLRGVAGYSLTSSPTAKGTVELAVKLGGENPVTKFLHEEVEIGDLLYIDGGQGDFYYRRDMGDSLVLIAGGIGITPIMSILRYVDSAEPDVRAVLVYSASRPSELLFYDQLTRIAGENKNISCIFTVTQPTNEPWEGHIRRIDAGLLKKAQIDLDALFFVCSPPSMGQEMVDLLDGLGVPASQIKYERWW